jgi:antitoxin (DNA-binding transcriptional repressor) of toxin-antitoxin stability system
MTRMSLHEVKARLPELIAALGPGEELEIVEGDRPIARLVREGPSPGRPRVPGSAVGVLTIRSDDDDHLADFAEYQP